MIIPINEEYRIIETNSTKTRFLVQQYRDKEWRGLSTHGSLTQAIFELGYIRQHKPLCAQTIPDVLTEIEQIVTAIRRAPKVEIKPW